ncbi:MAG: DUF6946 family protein [Nitrospinales bacterium]
MELIGVNLTTHSNVTFSFEYRVNVQKGVGNPSHTDLMLIIDKAGIAIEAKYTEPRYATVKKWRNDSENRRNVLEGWLNLIGSVTGESATIEAVDDIEYQLIHRLASVCHLKVKNRILVYQLFDSDDVKMGGYLSDLSKLKQIMSFNFDCFLINIPIIKSDSYAVLQRRWDNRERKMSEDVLKVVRDEDLIHFGDPRIIKL